MEDCEVGAEGLEGGVRAGEEEGFLEVAVFLFGCFLEAV